MRRVGRAFGGSINDVLLAVTDDGVHRYLDDAGERPAEPLVAMCPVSVREPGDVEPGTKASTMFVRLGSPRSGAARRLAEIVASTAAAKAEFHSMSREASLDFALLAFGLWLTSDAFGLGAYTRPVVNFVVSNVGGVEGTRYLGRSRLVGAFPGVDGRGPGRAQLHVASRTTGAWTSGSSPTARRCRTPVQSRGTAWPRGSACDGRGPPQDLTLRKPPARKPSRTRRMPASQRP